MIKTRLKSPCFNQTEQHMGGDTRKRAAGIYEKLVGDRLCLIYNGAFNDRLTHHIMELTEHNVAQFDELAHLRKKVSYLVVECFQNIVRHGEGEGPRGTFCTLSDGNVSRISALNMVRTDRVDQLGRCLAQINTLGMEELKALSREVMLSPRNNVGGAGLGLIEMARRSGDKLDYAFDVSEEELSKFFLTVSLNRHSAVAGQVDLKSRQLMDELMGTDVQLVYKGDFTPGTIEPILEIARQAAKADRQAKKLLGVLVEMASNIQNHGVYNGRHGGLLLIERKGDDLIVATANQCVPDLVETFHLELDRINSMTKCERMELISDSMQEELADLNVPMGLLKVANMSQSPIDYSIEPSGRTEFLTMSVTV
jgi:hypothetical protein